MVFPRPFQQDLNTSHKERNGNVAKKLLISGHQNQASNVETSERQCSDSCGNQQQLANKITLPQYSKDGGSSMSSNNELSIHPLKYTPKKRKLSVRK